MADERNAKNENGPQSLGRGREAPVRGRSRPSADDGAVGYGDSGADLGRAGAQQVSTVSGDIAHGPPQADALRNDDSAAQKQGSAAAAAGGTKGDGDAIDGKDSATTATNGEVGGAAIDTSIDRLGGRN